jgi:hypothetical protein
LNHKFDFFEKVRIKSSERSPELIGKVGAVIGISSDETTVYDYQLAFYDDTESASFLPNELESTGEFGQRSDFYDDDENSRIRVRVDKDGSGHIVS